MASVGYVNKEVQKMYGIPYNKLTAEQKRILHADSVRRSKLIEEREKAVIQNNKKAFEDEAKMEKVLASIYRDCQKKILADVTETISKVKKAGGEWSYANQSALTRSRGLFEQITEELTKLGQEEQTLFNQGLSNIYTDQFLRQVYELGQTIPVNANFNRLNPALIKKTLDYPWSGAMFSDRLWQDKETLGRNLRVGLTQSMVLGEGIPEITDRIAKGIDTSRYNAERLARTETKRVTYCAHNDAYEDMGVNELKYRCANGGDSRACSACLSENDNIYKRGEEPTLPRHPNCRCVYIPVVSDTFGDNELNELTHSVRGAENYEKWRAEQEKKLQKEVANLKIADKTDNDLLKDFTPAKTIAEAEDFASKFVGDGFSPTFKNKVVYKGISLDSANSINETLNDIYNLYNIPPLNGIKVISPTSSQGKKVFKDGADAIMAYNPVEHGIFINKDIMLNAKTLKEYNDRAKKAWDTVMDNLDSLSDNQKEIALLYKTAGRTLVGDGSVRDYVVHEMGHHIQWNCLDANTSNTIGDNMSKFAPKISGYANASKGEYIAESFVAFTKGETELLDPIFVDSLKTKTTWSKNFVLVGENDAVSEVITFTTKENGTIISTSKQIGKKVGKHAQDYGLDASKEEDRNIMRSNIQDILNNSTEIVTGEWLGQNGLVKFYIKDNDVVIVNSENEFVSILKGGTSNERVKSARDKNK